MQTCHLRSFGPLSRGVLAALTFVLPAACGIEDVIIDPGDPGDPGGPGDPGAPENPEAIYYDLHTFATEIQPAIDDAGCIVNGCHDRLSVTGGLGLFSNPAPGSNEMWFNLQALTSLVQLDTHPEFFSVEDTLLFVRAVDGHRGPAIDQPERLAAWLEEAAAHIDVPLDGFDLLVFGNTIQPALDARCAYAGCHDLATSAGGLGLHPTPFPESKEWFDNLRAMAREVDLSLARAEETLLFIRATDQHGATTFQGAERAVLQQWLQAALDADGVE